MSPNITWVPFFGFVLFVLIFFVVCKKEMCGICMEKKIKILHFLLQPCHVWFGTLDSMNFM